eukprot:1651104-Rhodomonas_salina.1
MSGGDRDWEEQERGGSALLAPHSERITLNPKPETRNQVSTCVTRTATCLTRVGLRQQLRESGCGIGIRGSGCRVERIGTAMEMEWIAWMVPGWAKSSSWAACEPRGKAKHRHERQDRIQKVSRKGDADPRLKAEPCTCTLNLRFKPGPLCKSGLRSADAKACQ